MKAINVSPFRSLVAQSNDLRPVLSSGQQEALKWLALMTMVLDHIDKILLAGSVPLLTWIGRLSFPLFAFLIAYNLVVREVKPNRYLYPLLIFALFTQPVTMWVIGDNDFNIFFTLCFGVLYVGLHALLSKRLHPLLSHALLVVIFLLPSFQMEYQTAGVFLIPALVFYLKWSTPLSYLGINLFLLFVNDVRPDAFVALLVLPLIFVLSRCPLHLVRRNPWVFYLFFPGHLIALELLSRYVAFRS